MFHNRMRYCVSVLACLSVLACGVRVEHEEQELMIPTNLSSAGSGTTSLVSGGTSTSAGTTTTSGTNSSSATTTATDTGLGDSSTNEGATDTSGATDRSIIGVWDMTSGKGTAEEVVTWVYINQVRITFFHDEQSFGGDGRNCFTQEFGREYYPSTAIDSGEHDYEYDGVVNTMFVLANGSLHWSFVNRDTEEAVLRILDPVENVQTSDDIQICN